MSPPASTRPAENLGDGGRKGGTEYRVGWGGWWEREKRKERENRGDRDKIIDTIYNIVMPDPFPRSRMPASIEKSVVCLVIPDVNRKLCNTLPRKFDELMNYTKKYNRYENIFNKSFEAYKTKIKYFYFIIISKNNEVYLTTYEQKQLEENLHVYDDKKINELYEKDIEIFDEEIERINKTILDNI